MSRHNACPQAVGQSVLLHQSVAGRPGGPARGGRDDEEDGQDDGDDGHDADDDGHNADNNGQDADTNGKDAERRW